MKNKLDKDSVLMVSQDQVSADLSSPAAESVVILHLRDGVYYELKDVGARVWNLIQKPCSIHSIISVLLEEYQVDAERCEIDLLSLAEDLIKRGLVEIK